jgi:hypothetical protein
MPTPRAAGYKLAGKTDQRPLGSAMCYDRIWPSRPVIPSVKTCRACTAGVGREPRLRVFADLVSLRHLFRAVLQYLRSPPSPKRSRR